MNKDIQLVNKDINLPEKLTWLKQPTLMTMMAAKMNTFHLRIFIGIIEQLQNNINENIKLKKEGKQLNLFENNNEFIFVEIKFKDLGINSRYYSKLKNAISDLSKITIELDSEDPVTKAPSWYITGLFSAYIPKDRYARTFRIEFKPIVANAMLNITEGFTQYVKEIAMGVKGKYTIRLYMLISSWKDKGGFKIEYKRLRKILGITENEYQLIKQFKQRVLDSSKKELYENADCWFEYQMIEKKDCLIVSFKVINYKHTVTEDNYVITRKKYIKRLLETHFSKIKKDEIEDILSKITIDNIREFSTGFSNIIVYIGENKDEISNKSNYVKKAIYNLLKELE